MDRVGIQMSTGIQQLVMDNTEELGEELNLQEEIPDISLTYQYAPRADKRPTVPQ